VRIRLELILFKFIAMNIWLVIFVIAIISIILSIIALISLENKSHVEQAKKKLSEGRVVFQDSSSER
jgi:hypothetical protein